MSAFLVSDETMHIITKHITRSARTFAGVAIDEDATRREASASRIGRLLFGMNEAALAARYGDEIQGIDYHARVIVPPTKIQALKAIKCLLYQCMEGSVPETQLYQELQRMAGGLAHEIVEALPEYHKASWDATPAEVERLA